MSVFHRCKKAEKQEINLLQLAAFAGMFESMHGLLILAQPAFKGKLRRLINKQVHSMLELKLTKFEEHFQKRFTVENIQPSSKIRSI